MEMNYDRCAGRYKYNKEAKEYDNGKNYHCSGPKGFAKIGRKSDICCPQNCGRTDIKWIVENTINLTLGEMKEDKIRLSRLCS